MRIVDKDGNVLGELPQVKFPDPLAGYKQWRDAGPQRDPNDPPAWAYSNGQISMHEWLMSVGRVEEAMELVPDSMKGED